MKRKLIALCTSALLALGLTAVGVATAIPAEAHTPSISATCDALSVNLTSYSSPPKDQDKRNRVTVWVDGSIVKDTTFNTDFSGTYAFSDNTVSHHYRVAINAWDNSQYDLDQSGDSTACAPPIKTTTPVAPTVTNTAACGTYGTVTPAETDGVDYAVDFNKDSGDYTVTATPKDGYKFDGDQTKTFTGNVGAYVACVASPNVTLFSTSECYPNSGFSSENVYLFLDNSASNTPVTFTGDGVNETLAAGATKKVEASPIWDNGGSFDIQAGDKAFTITVPSFPDCGAVINPSSTDAYGICVYNTDGTANQRSVSIVFDNSQSNRDVDFAVPYFPEYNQTVKAGAKVIVQAADIWAQGGGYTVTAGDKSFDLTIPACDETPQPKAHVQTSVGQPDCDAKTITTTTTTTKSIFDVTNEKWIPDTANAVTGITTQATTEKDCPTVITPPVVTPPTTTTTIPGPVVTPKAVAAVVPTPTSTLTPTASQGLADTGSNLAPLGLLGMVLLGVGGTAVILRRKAAQK